MENTKKLTNCRLRQSVLMCEGITLLVIKDRTEFEIKILDYGKIHHCLIFHCENFLQCIEYFKKASSQQCIILLFINFSNEQIQTMLSQLHSHRQLQAIFTLQLQKHQTNVENANHIETKPNETLENHLKSIQNFDQWDSLCSNLQNLINTTEKHINDTGLISTCNSAEKALRNLKHDLGAFVWTHTFRG
ncbi:unnamed protein product [Adineta ricciae]|uniref:Uncharacterized protein n=1 Tax=Adineta ricciae TaxID=249248 RepID=A0A816EY29_ADIRI|nr:unnamed protein product [Adineta ricciae]